MTGTDSKNKETGTAIGSDLVDVVLREPIIVDCVHLRKLPSLYVVLQRVRRDGGHADSRARKSEHCGYHKLV